MRETELGQLLEDDFKSALPPFSKIYIPRSIILSISKIPFDHQFEFCGYFVGQIQGKVIQMRCFEWQANLLLELVSNAQQCLEYLKVAEITTPPSRVYSLQKYLFWHMLNDRKLREKAIETLKGQFALRNFQELINEEAKVSSIPSETTKIIGEDSWYYEYERESLTKPITYYKLHLHSHPLGNRILPSSADLCNMPEISSIARIESNKAFSLCTYKSSGPGRTIFIAFFPINSVEASLEIELDKPKIMRVEADCEYEDWRREEKLGKEYEFYMRLI